MSPNSESKRDLLSASDYILENFEPSDRIAVLVRNRGTGETIQRITRATNAASPDFQGWLRRKNASGADIYVGMNSLKRDAQSRTKADVEKIRHLYLDIDRRGPQAVEAIENSGLVPRPNHILETSPEKFQVIWKVEDMPQDQAEAMQRAMVREFGGDPAATDSTRVLRWPTFANRKYEHEHIVKARAEATDTYHLEDFRLRTELQDEWREHAVSREPRQVRTGGEVTQSERDWAFAKRALARGDEPGEVISKITDYRGDEKHPNYARYTVEKAQAELQRNDSAKQDEGRALRDI